MLGISADWACRIEPVYHSELARIIGNFVDCKPQWLIIAQSIIIAGALFALVFLLIKLLRKRKHGSKGELANDEQQIAVPETHQEERLGASPVSDKKPARSSGLKYLAATLILAFLGIGFFLRQTHQSSSVSKTEQSARIPTPIPTAPVTEGDLQIKEGESMMFPSGAVLRIGGPQRGSELTFSYTKDTPSEERLFFSGKIRTYINGYLHTIEGAWCRTETRFHGDYWAPFIAECNMRSSIAPDVKPTLPSYDGLMLDFASVTSRSVSRFRVLQEKPWVAVSVPYFQIYKRSDGGAVNVVSPREDVVSIYTNYGRADFQFGADDLNQHHEKVEKSGPLMIQLTPQELTCAPPYVEEDRSCYNPDGKGTTFNVISFLMTIDEQITSEDFPLLLEIER